MPSHAHAQSHFQPPPPIRTSTVDSQKSQSSGAMSPSMLSPTSTAPSAASPTEESFFGAITTRMRRGRSRSRSRGRVSRKRSQSPMILPPEHFPSSSSSAQSMSPTSPTYTSSRPQQPRHVSTMSQTSVASAPVKPTRPSLQGPTRRSTNNSNMWRGRHSNSWLFNDFSVTDTAKDLFRRKS